MITHITYARLYNLGNYENERIEVTVSVEDGDLIAAHQEAVSAVQQAHDDLLDARRAPIAGPHPEQPATPKQRSYIAVLQQDIGWHSEQLAVYAREQGIDLVSMSSYDASTLIDGMKRLATQELPF
jgi:hypothetical protein